MKTIFKNKIISCILCVLPERNFCFFDEMEGGDSARNQKIARNMGFHMRYRAKADSNVSDFCIEGGRYLLDNGIIKKEEIGGIVSVTCTPDYYIPNVSNLIQGGLDLPMDILTFDIWDGCAGYINGLMHAFMYAERTNKKILLFNSNVINRGGENDTPNCYSTPPYGGDAASVTVIENGESDSIPFVMKTDGKGRDLIAFKQGGFVDLFHENKLKSTGVTPDPNASFRYFQSCVPDVIDEMSKMNKGKIDYYFFIQANTLSIKKMAEKCDLPFEKVPMDLVGKYGDTSDSLNPLSIVDTLQNDITKKSYRVMIVSYGAGTKWGTMVLTLQKDTFLKIIRTKL